MLQSERLSRSSVAARPGAQATTRPPVRRQSQASEAARRATWSAACRDAGRGSRNSPSRWRPGGSYSRATSSPRRALLLQWMRRRESPRRYSRTPKSSLPTPARGAARLASSSRTLVASLRDVKTGSARQTSRPAVTRSSRYRPMWSPVSSVQPSAESGPRATGPASRTAVQPAAGTSPVAADISAPARAPLSLAGPRALLAPRTSSTSIVSPSKTGSRGAVLTQTPGRSARGEPAPGTADLTATSARMPAELQRA